MTYDVNLIREVFSETRNGFKIHAMLTRFGGLAVFASRDGQYEWQGENILDARAWVDKEAVKCPLELTA